MCIWYKFVVVVTLVFNQCFQKRTDRTFSFNGHIDNELSYNVNTNQNTKQKGSIQNVNKIKHIIVSNSEFFGFK